MGIDFASAAVEARLLDEMIRPPKRVPVSRSAQDVVRITAVGGYNGPWTPAPTPYMVEPMDCLSSRLYDSVIFVGPARSGKTQALCDCWVAHNVTRDPGDMMIVCPTEILSDDYSKRRLRRLHTASPQIQEYLSTRAHDNTVRTTTYRHGMMLNFAWPSSSQLAQRDIRYVVLSDYDSMPDDIGGEGEAYQLAKKRTQTFGSSGMTMAESSPKRERIDAKWKPSSTHEAPPTSGGVMSLYNRGDRRRWYWQCLHCGEWFEAPAIPKYDDIGEPEICAQSAFVACIHCGGIHTQENKRELNLAGRWLRDGEAIDKEGHVHGSGVNSTMATFWMMGCAAAFQTWESIVLNYLLAMKEYDRTGSEKALITTCNIDQGMPYLSKRKKAARTSEELEKRAEEWTIGTIPPGVRYLLALADVQVNKFVVQVIGYGEQSESWIIDRFDILQSSRRAVSGEFEHIDPAAHQEDWQRLSSVIEKRYPLGDDTGRVMAIHAMACDSGGRSGVTERAYQWWRRMKRSGKQRRIRLLKGDGNPKSARIRETYPDSRANKRRKTISRGDVPLLMLNTNEWKDTVDADLKRSTPGPGYVHFPSWLPVAAYEELSAESRGPNGKWTKISRSGTNETWDLMVYGRALSAFLGVGQINWTSPPAWAEDWSSNTNVTDGAKPSSGNNAIAAADYRII
ncbi:MAG: phage terminase large subunit family protein [Desulfobulbaceae bacterium]|nr:phage terminase large subunit family protein [Desulfobulbaceae bacterium]